MLTIKQVFRDAISSGNWDEICEVYKAITGEEAPTPSKTDVVQPPAFEDILSRPFYNSENDGVHNDTHKDNEKVPVIITPSSPSPQITPSTPPVEEKKEVTPKNATANDFAIQHKKTSERKNSGEQQCRREPIGKTTRVNQWTDDGSFDHERVDKHPDDPTLGVRNVRPRGHERDSKLGIDTSKLVDVVCGLCGKEERVSPILATNYRTDPEQNAYRCNECNSPKGRARANKN